MGVDAEREPGERFRDDRERRSHLRWQRAAVGVAQDHPLGASLGGRPQAVEGVAGVEREAVEEVLRVEQDALAGADQERDGFADHHEVLLTAGPHDLLDVEHGGLPHERTHGGDAFREHPQPLVLIRGGVAAPGHPERDDLGGLQALPPEQTEQLELLGVGRREAGLDHVHAEVVERVHDA